eukprot:28706-Eustigmatos_ZCMA.PRE.1
MEDCGPFPEGGPKTERLGQKLPQHGRTMPPVEEYGGPRCVLVASWVVIAVSQGRTTFGLAH